MEEFLYQVGFLNWTAGWSPVISFTLVAVLIIYTSARAVGGRKLRIPKLREWKQLLWEPFSAFYQQLILFSLLFFFKSNFVEFYWWNEVAVGIFILAHWPNLFYQFPAGFMMINMIHFMEKYHNIYATIIAHAIIGLFYLRCPPKYITTFSKPYGRYIKRQRRFTRMLVRLIHKTKVS